MGNVTYADVSLAHSPLPPGFWLSRNGSQIVLTYDKDAIGNRTVEVNVNVTNVVYNNGDNFISDLNEAISNYLSPI